MSSLQLHCFRQINVQCRNDVITRILFRLVVSAHSGCSHEGFRCISIVQAAVYFSCPGCRVLQLSRPPCTSVVQAAVYFISPGCRVLHMSRLPCTSYVQTAVYSKLSGLPWRLPCTSGCPGCCVLQVVQAVLQVVKLLCTSVVLTAVYFSCPDCRVLQLS